METLRGSISDAVNAINKLLIDLDLTPEQEHELRKLRRLYFDLWEEVIKWEINSHTEEFKSAIAALKTAHDEAVEAQTDLARIGQVIAKAASAAKAVDAVLKLVTRVF